MSRVGLEGRVARIEKLIRKSNKVIKYNVKCEGCGKDTFILKDVEYESPLQCWECFKKSIANNNKEQ